MANLICEQCGQPFESIHKTQKYCGIECRGKAHSAYKQAQLSAERLHVVWSCGGGVQSSAIAALMVSGQLPKPDYAIMVDVGREKQSTWEHVNAVIIPKLASVGVPLHIVKTTDYTDIDLHNNGCLLIPAYEKTESGKKRYKTLCSNTWKTVIIRRWLRQQGVRRCVVWIGISLNEARRVRPSAHQWCENRYPLIEKKMYKEDCLCLAAQMGWPQAPRTSCWMCPGQTNQEWYVMQRYWPDDWQRAINLEQEIQETRPNTYLHSSLVPLGRVDLSKKNPDQMCIRNINDCVCI